MRLTAPWTRRTAAEIDTSDTPCLPALYHVLTPTTLRVLACMGSCYVRCYGIDMPFKYCICTQNMIRSSSETVGGK